MTVITTTTTYIWYIVDSDLLKRMEVYQQISMSRGCTISDLEKIGTLQAYTIEPNEDYRLDLNRQRYQSSDSSWSLYILDSPYGEDNCMDKDNCHLQYCANPHLIVDTDNGQNHVSNSEKHPIMLQGCHNQITFSISGNFFPAACDNCNTFWLRVAYYHSLWKNYQFYKNQKQYEEDIPLVIRSTNTLTNRTIIQCCKRLANVDINKQ
jgi:hypothetical protein